jgi:EAL domain-containing protein (putative c-di-GMP-specific phosphodiesterase class I)
MSRSLHLRVVADGVETEEDLVFLKAHGCDEGQGYYFSRPVPPEQFAGLLGTNLADPCGIRRGEGACSSRRCVG